MDDLRFALRQLRRSPGFTAVAIGTLALGIGINTAVYSVVRGLLWRPLPFPDAERVVAVRGANPARGITDYEVSLPDLADLAARGTTFSDLAAFYGRNAAITGPDGADRIRAVVAEPSLFRIVGLPPLLGRVFRPDEARPGAVPVAVLSEGLWRRRFGADRAVVGQVVPIDGVGHEVVGVMPRGFDFERTDIWLPLVANPALPREDRYARGIGRLRDGATVEQARAELVGAAARLEEQHPVTNRGWTVEVLRYRDDIIDPGSRWRLWLMMGAVVGVLLVACANVAGLMLARATARQRELAVRAAVGASRGRLVRQVLAESVVLAATGAAAGMLLASWWSGALLATLTPEDLPPWLDVSLDASALAVTVLAVVVSALAFGLLPALRASRPDLVGALKGAARAVASPGGRLRQALVVGQVAVSMVLLAASALFMQSFLAMRRGDLGFDDRGLATARVYFEARERRAPQGRVAWMRDALARLRELPGVRAAALTGSIPGDDGGDRVPLTVQGRAVAEGDEVMVVVVPTSDQFFEALGTTLLEGRGFSAAEAEDTAAAVAVVGQALAERVWPGESPIGRRIRAGNPADSGWMTVIGVARNIQYEEFGEDVQADRLQVHVPYGRELWRGAAVLARTSADPGSRMTEFQRTLRSVSSDVAVFDVRTMAQVRSETSSGDRIWLFIFGTFGAQALVVAAVGLYALLAYGVAQRRREIGVRIALGARPGSVVAMVVRQAAALAGLGLLAGIGGAWTIARVLRGLLWGVGGTLEPLALVSVVLALTALAAAFAPARRAAGVDPMEALRAE